MFIDFLTFSLRKYYFMLNLYRENEHQLALRFMGGLSSRSHTLIRITYVVWLFGMTNAPPLIMKEKVYN